MNVQPIGKAFVIELERTVTTRSGLEYNGGRPETGRIIAIGNDVHGVSVGDLVIFRKFMISAEPTSIDGKNLYFGEDYEKALVAIINEDVPFDAELEAIVGNPSFTIAEQMDKLKTLFYKNYHYDKTREV